MLEWLTDFIDVLYSEGQHFSLLEIIGVITALIYVGLATKGNRWCFLFGLISSSVYVYLTLVLKLYFDFGINIYYVIMSFYGWVSWSNNDSNSPTTVQSLEKRTFLTWCTLGIVVAVVLAFGASLLSDASLPYIDSFTTTFSVIATFLVVKKYIENWLIWIAVDFISAGLYFYKELYLTSLLFLIYTGIAIIGFLKWKKLLTNP